MKTSFRIRPSLQSLAYKVNTSQAKTSILSFKRLTTIRMEFASEMFLDMKLLVLSYSIRKA